MKMEKFCNVTLMTYFYNVTKITSYYPTFLFLLHHNQFAGPRVGQITQLRIKDIKAIRYLCNYNRSFINYICDKIRWLEGYNRIAEIFLSG